ncbi:diacylglycerol/lipid kinase family protein [Lacticaseibacillus pantheris]|uniref:Diacylglycerol kinase family protein n=1 Tax=Lacticaseibacillus pantheris DSM 15945 = JCM 12539 = NBRC 106106 TaxID=1423783 RepID=A0A0R1TWF4_9LACO|nr:diacylglycerol kinase family protein [Lacticaseibacillus pantheris]KRL85569.1 diacylglycerol kinase family protein [Lacticaseibacillus pantheris DSM 15945 = JCM 12539 = NBRC 106106]WKF85398.1 diacylglycerol kinase family lipid kinase [Lacticaseibacillus pantheris]
MAFFQIIFNPAAGGGNSVATWHIVKDELNRRGVEFRVRTSKHPGHTVELAHQIAKFNDRDDTVLLVIGGDGTLNQAVTGIREAGNTTMPVAYVPAGSGNDFARANRISKDPLKVLDAIIDTTEPVRIDIGEFHERTRNQHGYFVNNVGVGFDAAVVDAANHSRVKPFLNRMHLGTLAYLLSVFSVLFNRHAFEARVNVGDDHDIIPNAYICTTTNHPYFGGGVRIMPGASVIDGQLDLVIVEEKHFFTFLFLMIQILFRKKLDFEGIHHYRADRLYVETSSLEFGQMDGEELGTRPFELEFNVSHQLFWMGDLNPQ